MIFLTMPQKHEVVVIWFLILAVLFCQLLALLKWKNRSSRERWKTAKKKPQQIRDSDLPIAVARKK